MGLSDTNIPNASADVVGVFDQNFNQVFPLARPIKALVDESAKAMEHPVETGTVITDHIIFQPNEIELAMILPGGEYRSVYQQIEQIYKLATVLSVQTKAATYGNMFIYHMPHQESPDYYDTINLIIRMREILIIETTTQALPPTAVANPIDQSTVKTGLQQPSVTQALPGPAAFEQFGPIAPLASTTPKPAPNAASFDKYNDIGLDTAPLTQTQLEQLLGASRIPKGSQ